VLSLSNLVPATRLLYRRMDRLEFDMETSFFDNICSCVLVDHGSHCQEVRIFG
jgi:hypothetical protein